MSTNINSPSMAGPVVGKLYKANKILGSSNVGTMVIIQKNTVIMLIEIFTPPGPFTLLACKFLHNGSVTTRYYGKNFDNITTSWNEDFTLCDV